MKYAQIIADAWDVTLSCEKLKWFFFFPSFMAVLIFIMEVCWQLFLYIDEFEFIKTSLSFSMIGDFFGFILDHGLLGWAIFALLFLLLFAFVIPSWLSAVLILSLKQKIQMPEKYLSVRQKMISGFGYFFPLFELHAIMSLISIWSIAFFTATLFRFFHDSFFQILWPVLLVYSIFALLFSTLLSFAPFYVVCENLSVQQSMKKSFSLVFTHIGATMALLLLMFLVNIRILVNVVVILGVPIGISMALTYMASSWIVILSILLGILLMGLTAYLSAVVEIFSTTVWTKAFFILKEKQEKLESFESQEDETVA